MKKIILSIFFLFGSFAFPSATHAQMPFGGLDIFEFPCTCSPFMYTVFTPLFLSSPIPLAGPLAVPDAPTLFPFYILFPTAWALGTFTPGAQACWMYVGVGCAPLPVLGTMLPFTGTSL